MEEIEKMMALALAANEVAAQNMVTGARAEREKAAEERAAAQEALLETERNAQALYQGYVGKHRTRISRDLHLEVAKGMAERLLRAGESLSEAAALLDLPDGMVQELAKKK